ncbi:hypothetical protein ABEY57_26135, partial [Bacillus tropicus]|uniref:hypothetical protein n=1 Tax=Bacillus tropicus TaxID=2026188 RepID=UPI000BF93869|nr:hypothetical protein CN394_06490 [Bacillus anthracis]PEZ77137.1 hypothetical protein CN410_09045 [Bacillus anthracis]
MLYIHFIYKEDNNEKRNILFSYLFLFIIVIAVMIECLCISFLFFYSHYFKYILVVEIKFPIKGIILGALGKTGKQKIIAITLNSLIFILFPL